MDIHGAESRAVHNKRFKDKKLYSNVNADSTDDPSRSNLASRRKLKKNFKDDGDDSSSSASSGNDTKF